jgi:hypothetical protein
MGTLSDSFRAGGHKTLVLAVWRERPAKTTTLLDDPGMVVDDI